MASRPELHEELCEILGSRNVYFQPPESVKMKYPAIRYKRARVDNRSANDSVYLQWNGYELVLIDPNPDSNFVETLSKRPNCRWERHYFADGLNHDVFTIY